MDITSGFPEKKKWKKYSYKRDFVISQGPGPVNKVENKNGQNSFGDRKSINHCDKDEHISWPSLFPTF